MAKDSTTGANAPTKTKLEIAKEAQAEVQSSLNEKRIDSLETLLEFKSIGGEDDVEEAVMEVATHFKKGIPFPFLQSVFPDALLTKACNELVKKGQIEKSGKKGKFIIKLAEAK